MMNVSHYPSPLGDILLASDDIGLVGVWFEGDKYYGDILPENPVEEETPVLKETKRWLDVYFCGKEPDFLPPLHPIGSPFRQEVWQELLKIPYGKTMTYGEIAKSLERKTGKRVSSQAVGGAVSHNEICILIPCHRVMGAKGNLTGYAAGLDKKIALLKLEGAFQERFFAPKH